MSEVEKIFFGFKVEMLTMATQLFEKTVNVYADAVRKNFEVRKPVVIDHKRMTTVKGSTVARHVLTTVGGNDKEMARSVFVDPSDQQILLDARRYENYPQEHGVGPFRKAVITYRDKEVLQKILREPSKKPGAIDAFPDLEVH
jgi:hypothetical protein